MRQTQNTQKKDNRKSVFVIALLLLLVAVIGFGGYTLSKYVTNKSATGSASVAQWGYTIEADASGIFGTDYVYNTDKAVSIVKTTESTALTVSAKNTERTNRVAPGTTGSMTFTVKGKAEVLSQIKISIADTEFSDVVLKYTEGTDTTVKTYNPVKWTLKKDGEATALVDGKTLKDVKEALAKLYKTEAGKDASTAVNTAIDDKYTLSWVWDFSTNDVNDNLDTLLGMIAHDNSVTANGSYKKAEGTSTEIKFTLDISVVQLQKENA